MPEPRRKTGDELVQFWCVWLADKRDAYRREDANRPRHEFEIWTTPSRAQAEAKADHLDGHVIRADVLEKNFKAMVKGELVILGSRNAPSLWAKPEGDADAR